ncbi:MAG: beta-ketoacyl-[acyl-carrier-protein] synthase family protein [Deltaproteobacteria bacterium]|nr:beta-ketoacyl-[acyl-carrier-protein] synthase family protein [Deltaproteobacteria bacterium]
MARRVAITGLGAVTPLGNDVATFWRRLLAGESGVDFIRDFPTEALRSDVCASVKGFEPERYLTKKEAEIYGRVTQFSLAAAVEAMDHAGLGGLMKVDVPGGEERALRGAPVDRAKVGCLMSTGQGSVDIFEQQIEKSRERGPRAVSPFFIPGVMPNSGTALVSMRFGLMGPSYNLASACATGTHSIATGALMIEAGLAEVMVVGGAEAATRLNTVAGFGNARALTRAKDGDPTRSSRPFDVDRSGFVMGEGAGVLVLEARDHAEARGATILGELVGYGMSSDGEHLTRPHEDGRGIRLAVEQALARAGLGPDAIDYVNPHATSTPAGDIAEVRALRAIFGERLATLPLSATKSLVGHLLGGAGAVESIAVVLSLREGRVHPSLNVDTLDPELGTVDVVRGAARDLNLRNALKISAGFGGHNCALVFGRAEAVSQGEAR